MIPWSYFSLCAAPLQWCGSSLPANTVLHLSLWAPSATSQYVKPLSHLTRVYHHLLRRNFATLSRFIRWVWFALQTFVWGRRLTMAALQLANALHTVSPSTAIRPVLLLDVVSIPSSFSIMRWCPRRHAQKFLPYVAFLSLLRNGLFVVGSLDRPLVITTATDMTWFFLIYFKSRGKNTTASSGYNWVVSLPRLELYTF